MPWGGGEKAVMTRFIVKSFRVDATWLELGRRAKTHLPILDGFIIGLG